MKTGSSVLDASALLAYLKGEPRSDAVKNLLKGAANGGQAIFINEINLGEVFYILARERSMEYAKYFLHDVLPLLPIIPMPNTMNEVVAAAELKIRLDLHYTDAFAAVTAMQQNASLVTTDSDFERMQKEIQILWL